MAIMFIRTFYLIALLLVTVGLAIPKPENGKTNRVYDKPLSDEEHFGESNEHNSEFDHEAFLGEEAKTFDQLTPEESKERLVKIVHKIDKNKDGYVTHEELKDWISYTQKKYIMDDVDRQWAAHNPEEKEDLDWDDYERVTYAFIDDAAETESDVKTYKAMKEKDKRRWEAADKDGDTRLSKEEFSDFLHPEEAPHMHEIVILETLSDIDKNKDGKISLEEYIGDMYTSDSDADGEPDWVKNEREQFSTYRDKNKDGFMDKDEVSAWILPADYNHSDAEAKHLIHESDANKDQKLTVEEILDKYDLFVGSQATDFGEALASHDEF